MVNFIHVKSTALVVGIELEIKLNNSFLLGVTLLMSLSIFKIKILKKINLSVLNNCSLTFVFIAFNFLLADLTQFVTLTSSIHLSKEIYTTYI